MNKIAIGVIASFVTLMIFAPSVQGQTTDKSLGEAARAQRDLHPATKLQKTYNNDDVEAPGARWKSREVRAQAAPPQSSALAPETLTAETSKPEQFPKRSVLDHRTDEQEAEDGLVVPEGTELKIEVPPNPSSPVDVYAARVVAPVRIGFATAIPALSTATVQVVTRHYPYQDRSWYGGYNLGYFETLAVTQIVVDGVPYDVQTEQVGRPWEGPSPSELTFRLLKPLLIER
jgi:hypothetical protein